MQRLACLHCRIEVVKYFLKQSVIGFLILASHILNLTNKPQYWQFYRGVHTLKNRCQEDPKSGFTVVP